MGRVSCFEAAHGLLGCRMISCGATQDNDNKYLARLDPANVEHLGQLIVLWRHADPLCPASPFSAPFDISLAAAAPARAGTMSGLCRYFARLAEERMGPEDQVILVTHQPRWLMDWFWAKAAAPNLRQLVRGHLRGRARVHLAGMYTAVVSEESSLAFALLVLSLCFPSLNFSVPALSLD